MTYTDGTNPSVQYEASQPRKKKTSKSWTVRSVCTLCDALEREFFGAKHTVYWMTQHKEAFSRVLAHCDAEEIDPEVFLRAQYAQTAAYLKNQGLRRLPANVLYGKGAVARYNKYLDQTVARGGKLRKQDSADDNEVPDTLYWQHCVRILLVYPAVTDKDLNHVVKAIQSQFPNWSPDPDSPTWLAAIANCVDDVQPGISAWIHVSSEITPRKLAQFLKNLHEPEDEQESVSLGHGQLSTYRLSD